MCWRHVTCHNTGEILHSQCDTSECYQVAHNQYTETRSIGGHSAFNAESDVIKSTKHIVKQTKRLLQTRPQHSTKNVIQNLSWSGRAGTDMTGHWWLASHWGRWQTALNIESQYSSQWRICREATTGAQWAVGQAGRGAAEICQLEWAGRSRGCGHRHSDTLSSEPDKKYLQTMIRWWD